MPPFGKGCLSFNSKLVRLEVISHLIATTTVIVFQFQTGSIRSIRKINKGMLRLVMFQFQTGSIRSELGFVSLPCRAISFNSKLVRLEG